MTHTEGARRICKRWPCNEQRQMTDKHTVQLSRTNRLASGVSTDKCLGDRALGACGWRGNWSQCGSDKAHSFWTASSNEMCGWKHLNAARLRSLLVQLSEPSLLFWGDSTMRMLFYDGARLLTANSTSDDNYQCSPPDPAEDPIYAETETSGDLAIMTGETVLFDHFNCKQLSNSKRSSRCLLDGCLMRSYRHVDAKLDDGRVGTIELYGSSRLHCPHMPKTAMPSLYDRLRAQCPGAIVATHNIHDCRWFRKEHAPWPEYDYQADLWNATRMVSALCPPTLKLWRSSNTIDSHRSPYGEATVYLDQCQQENECIRDEAVAADWPVSCRNVTP